MHPILLFTLLFLPGIKSSFEVKTEVVDFPRDGGEAAVSNPGIAPIEEPNTIDNLVEPEEPNTNPLNPYDHHYNHKYDKHYKKENREYTKSHDFISSKDNNWERKQKYHDYKHDQNAPKHYDDEHKHFESRQNYEKNHYKEHEHKYDDDFGKYKQMKKYKEYKDKKYGQDDDDDDDDDNNKYNEKHKEYSKDMKKDHDHHNKEYQMNKEHGKYKKDEYYKKHHNYDKGKKDRSKRHAESDSEEEDYNDDDDDDDGMNTSVESAERRQLMDHFMEGTKEDTPYEDNIEVRLQDGAGGNNKAPVVEEKINKKMAYVSCGRDGTGCDREQKDTRARHEQNVHAERTETEVQEENQHESNEEHIDMAAWLKAFEEEIIKSGIHLRYNHN